MLSNFSEKEILNNVNLNNLFLSASLQKIEEKCKILKGDFYLDSFNYFPITTNKETFYKLFKKEDGNSIDHFYKENFYKNLIDNEKNFKVFENSFILGSSPSDNYFSNLIHFLPRIFFTNEKKIDVVIHRNLSNKFRKLIKSICESRDIEIKFIFLDDEFYKFQKSQIPQFFPILKSINILKFFFEKVLLNTKVPDFRKKIYIRREDAHYRKIINEADLIDILRNNNFEIINPNHFEILEQIKIFSNADLIISPHGSNLSNLIFTKKGTKVIEIRPNFQEPYEINIADRYKKIANSFSLDYSIVNADTVDVKSHSNIAKKYINKNVLSHSNYYKNMILKISEIDLLIKNNK